MRTTIIIACLGVAITVHGQLAPRAQAPLSAHLLEVNGQWRTMDPAPTGGNALVAFANDTERIATHLRMVRERLMERDTHALGATARQQRSRLLQRLGDYAEAGVFPRNEVLPYRNPVFIDPHGTACAVGWLMIESGHRDLADAISEDLNLGYVHEIIADVRYAVRVTTWAQEHGFNGDELAWIQPSYAPPVQWMDLGGGTDGPVRVLHPLANGHLLLAGDFTLAGGVAAPAVAVWDGAGYQALGTGVQGTVECAVEWNGQLMLGGSFNGGLADLATWDGTTWTYSQVFPGMSPAVHALHVHAGVLHAAGESSGFAGTDHQVVRWMNGQWENVGSPMNAMIRCLETHDGALIAGGEFDLLVHPTDPLLRFTARLDGGDWLEFGGGLDAPVHDLLAVQDTLYAAGRLLNNILPTFGLAEIPAGGSTWTTLLPDHTSYMSSPGPAWINTMAARQQEVYFGGSFDIYQMMGFGQHIAHYLGQPNAVEPMALLDGPVHALAVWNDRLVMGGDFATAHAHVAWTDLTVSIRPTPLTTRTAQLFPVPSRGELTVMHPALRDGSGHLELLDASGSVLGAPRRVSGERSELHLGPLAAGRYQMRIRWDGHEEVLPFVVH